MRLERECQDKTSMNTNGSLQWRHLGYIFNSFASLLSVVQTLVNREVIQRVEKS